jgi:hypothetical protein
MSKSPRPSTNKYSASIQRRSSSDKYSYSTSSSRKCSKSVEKSRHRSRSHKSPEVKSRHRSSDRKKGHRSPSKTLHHSFTDKKSEIKSLVKKPKEGTPDEKLGLKSLFQKLCQNFANKGFLDKSPEKSTESNSLLTCPSPQQFGYTRPNYLAWRTPPETHVRCPDKNAPEKETLVDILGSFQLRHYTYKSPPSEPVEESIVPKTESILSSVTKLSGRTPGKRVQDSQAATTTEQNRNLGKQRAIKCTYHFKVRSC